MAGCCEHDESCWRFWSEKCQKSADEITLLREFARVLIDDDYLRAAAMVAKHPTLADLGPASVLDKG
jgi:hypothetical protein